MSYNSNLGYTESNPYVVSGQFTNANSSQYTGNFGSNETQGGPTCNSLKGGRKSNKWKDSIQLKIKNITRKYNTMAKSRIRRMRKRIRSGKLRKSKSKSRNLHGGWQRHHKRSIRRSIRNKKQKGGYAQYGSNMPYPSSYSTGGNLLAANSSLANPHPFMANAAEVDNYNHFTNKGFSSHGN